MLSNFGGGGGGGGNFFAKATLAYCKNISPDCQYDKGCHIHYKKMPVTFLLTQPTRDIKISTLMKNTHCTALLVTY